MRKNAFAFAFALIGGGIGLFIAADWKEFSIIPVLLGLCFGCFAGYFIAGLTGAKSTILQQNFAMLGNVRGLTIEEIVSKVGSYTSSTQCTIKDRNNEHGRQYSWFESGFSVSLLFGADGKCIGVINQNTNE